jgi:hypothetical protein
MKIRLISVFVVLMVVAVVILFHSCDMFGVTKEQRITVLVEDLNQNPRPNSIRYNFSPSCVVYSTIDSTFFNTDFQMDSIPYTVYNLNLDSDPVTGTISGTGGSFGGPWSIEFTMVQDGSDWLILELWLEIAGTVVQ